MALSTWVANFHGATADPNTTPYETILLSTVAAYSGYATKSIFILEPHHNKRISGEPLVDISGWQTKRMTVRQVFDQMVTYPFNYTTGTGDQDMADYYDLIAVLQKPALWISVRGGSEKWPSDVLYVHPVIVEVGDPSYNIKNGTRTYPITVELKGLS